MPRTAQRSMSDPTVTECLWCDREATRLCDAVIAGLAMTGMKGRYCYTGEVFTCDAPMCAGCSKVVGNICGKNYHDFIERCPMCAADAPKMQPMLPDEAASFRRERHATARRSKLRAVTD